MELIQSIPLFGGFLSSLIAFVATLSIIVFIHEYGHYIVGRWSGIHAEVFSLGFGPVLFARNDKRGTRWQLAAIPFGGYVKFLGDADASSRTDVDALEKMDSETRSRSFHGAKLYKKALTVAAGPVANFILSTIIFTAMVLNSGLATDEVQVGELKALPSSYTLENNDIIQSVNGVELASYDDLFEYTRGDSPLGEQVYEVLRAGERRTALGPFPLLPLIDNVQPQSAAMAAGLQIGDLILSVDSTEIIAFRELQAIVAASEGREMDLKVWRAGEVLDFTLAAKLVDVPDGDGGFTQRTLIGITGGLFFEPETYRPGVVKALGLGLASTGDIITGSLSGLKHMITGAISSCNLQGPVGIAQTSGQAASMGLSSFIWFVAVLSTAIGLLNLFPVPVLDGGHLLFFGYEAIFRRPPNDKVLQVLMSAGLVVILSLMAFGLTNDFRC